MKKRIFATIAVLVMLVGSPLAVQAAVTQNNFDKETYVVKETVNDDLYTVADEKLVVEGDVNGDLFAVSGKVDVKGNVKGDVYVAGGSITIENTVEGSIYVAGGQVNLDGNVARSIFVAGGNIDIRGNVAEDILVMGGQIRVDGEVGEDIRAAGGSLDLSNKVGGDVMASGGDITLDGDVVGDVHLAGGNVDVNSATIGGDLVFYGEEKSFTVSSNTKVGGEKRVEVKKDFNVGDKPSVRPFFKGGGAVAGAFGFVFKIVWSVLMGLGAILLGLLVVKFAPVKTEDTLKKMDGTNEMVKSLGIGCLAIPVAIVIAIALFISVVGWPILAVLFALSLIAKMLVLPLAGLYFGRWIVGALGGDKNGVFLPLLLGVVVIQLVRLIPCVGGIVELIIFFVAIGAMIRMQYQKHNEAKETVRKKK